LKDVVKLLNNILKIIVIMLSSAMVIVVFAQVVFRYFFKSPLPWSEELARYLFIWLIYIGAASAYGHRNLICIEIFSSKIPKRFVHHYRLLLDILSAFFIVIVGYAGIAFIPIIIGNLTPALRISWAFIYIVIPISMVSMAIFFISFFIEDLRALRRKIGIHSMGR
jgi:TRAP-type C4-dicarboxylate transport system permease small subunit